MNKISNYYFLKRICGNLSLCNEYKYTYSNVFISIRVSNHITKFPLYSLWEILCEKLLRLFRKEIPEQDISSFGFLISITLTDVDVSLHVMFETTECESSDRYTAKQKQKYFFFRNIYRGKSRLQNFAFLYETYAQRLCILNTTFSLQ